MPPSPHAEPEFAEALDVLDSPKNARAHYPTYSAALRRPPFRTSYVPVHQKSHSSAASLAYAFSAQSAEEGRCHKLSGVLIDSQIKNLVKMGSPVTI